MTWPDGPFPEHPQSEPCAISRATCDVCDGNGEHDCWNCIERDKAGKVVFLLPIENCQTRERHLDDSEGEERRTVTCRACGGHGLIGIQMP